MVLFIDVVVIAVYAEFSTTRLEVVVIPLIEALVPTTSPPLKFQELKFPENEVEDVTRLTTKPLFTTSPLVAVGGPEASTLVI